MKFSVPKNILFLIFGFLILDTINQSQVLVFSSLAEIIQEMNNHTLTTHFGIEPTATRLAFMNSAMTSVEEVGGIFAILCLFPLADTKGRKFVAVYVRIAITLLVGSCQFLAAVFQASEVFLLGQMILGSHYSIRHFTSIMYILECTPDNCRGFAGTFLVFDYVLAKLFMFTAASPSLLGTTSSWFIFPLVTMISSVAVLFFLLRFPESPKWLVQQNRIQEAKNSIKIYHGRNCEIEQVVTSMIKEKNLTDEEKLTLRQIWENETLRQVELAFLWRCIHVRIQAFKILMALLIFNVFDTTMVLSVYTILLHKEAGFTVQMTMNITLILTFITVPTKFFGTFMLDGLGRRPTLLIAGVMEYMKSSLLLTTQTIIYFVGSSLLTQILYVISEFLNAIVPATGVHTIRILFVTELFPPSARTAVAQALMFGGMILSTPITTLFPIIDSIFPPIYYFPFVIVQLIFGVYLYRHLPETRGKSVYEIIESMDNEVGSRAPTISTEKTPLLRDRATTHAIRRASILNTPRTRALTIHQSLLSMKL
ncbi:Protein CBG01151 [Caenorhabditis briggsae]|uniref:Protein CBG01151 n=1 Tax=Caenorhabditis briggsae TaxID=6238 RepID=A8WPP5_CAEBR|nr:Protein CBG01151 [Caenorhabditis briggsae]CAP22452.2 Protein CBG01151 [Caenorhabditis briggsae]